MNRKHQTISLLLPAVLLVLAVTVAACLTETPSTRPPVTVEPTKAPVLPDLVAAIKGPASARQGQALRDSIVVEVTNVGDATAGRFAVGLYFSTDKIVDQRDDLLLLGGREFVESLEPGKTIIVQLNGANTLPKEAPLGERYLGIIVDEANAVKELNEADNTARWPIIITD